MTTPFFAPGRSVPKRRRSRNQKESEVNKLRLALDQGYKQPGRQTGGEKEYSSTKPYYPIVV